MATFEACRLPFPAMKVNNMSQITWNFPIKCWTCSQNFRRNILAPESWKFEASTVQNLLFSLDQFQLTKHVLLRKNHTLKLVVLPFLTQLSQAKVVMLCAVSFSQGLNLDFLIFNFIPSGENQISGRVLKVLKSKHFGRWKFFGEGSGDLLIGSKIFFNDICMQCRYNA